MVRGPTFGGTAENGVTPASVVFSRPAMIVTASVCNCLIPIELNALIAGGTICVPDAIGAGELIKDLVASR